MDIKIRCPHCDTKLVVDDDLVGQSVLCEDCDKQFTVEKPAASGSGERPRVRDREDDETPRRRRDEDERPRSRDDYDDEDDRPRRRRPARRASNAAPLVFGSLLLAATLAVGVGLFFAFGFNAPRGGSAGGGPAGGGPVGDHRFRVTAAQWQPTGFLVTVETATGQPDVNAVRLVYQSDDGRSGSHAFSMAFTGRTTFFVNRGGFGRSRTSMWVDMGGAAVSAPYTLN